MSESVSSSSMYPNQGFPSVLYTGEEVRLNPTPTMDRSIGMLVYSAFDPEDTRTFVSSGYNEMIPVDEVLAVAALGYRSAYAVAQTWTGGAEAGRQPEGSVGGTDATGQPIEMPKWQQGNAHVGREGGFWRPAYSWPWYRKLNDDPGSAL